MTIGVDLKNVVRRSAQSSHEEEIICKRAHPLPRSRLLDCVYLVMVDAGPDSRPESTKEDNKARDLHADMNPEDVTTC
jgi:hypothetical protein